jgi:hypothetical protein
MELSDDEVEVAENTPGGGFQEGGIYEGLDPTEVNNLDPDVKYWFFERPQKPPPRSSVILWS